MTNVKLVLGIAVGLVIALLAGWFWGASGRSGMARALQTSELRSELLGARAAILDARVAVYNVNSATLPAAWRAHAGDVGGDRAHWPSGRGGVCGPAPATVPNPVAASPLRFA
jgi:hypothetical protein